MVRPAMGFHAEAQRNAEAQSRAPVASERPMRYAKFERPQLPTRHSERAELPLSFRASAAPSVIPSERSESRNRDRPDRGRTAHSSSPSTTPEKHSRRALRTERPRYGGDAVPRSLISLRPLRMLLYEPDRASGKRGEEISAPDFNKRTWGRHPAVSGAEVLLGPLQTPRLSVISSCRASGLRGPLSGRSRLLDSHCSLGMTTGLLRSK